MSTLSGVDLGDQCLWLDRHAWSRCIQIESATLGGSVRVSQQFRQNGRPITLDCGWLTGTVLAQLESLRDAGASMVLSHNSASYSVMFRHSDGDPVESTPVVDYADPSDSDYHDVILRLVEI